MRRLYTSTYSDMTVYQMDFGFGGFVGYGGDVLQIAKSMYRL